MSDDVRPDSSQPEPGDPGNDAAAAEEARLKAEEAHKKISGEQK